MAELLPTLPGMVDGIVGRDLLGWTVQCSQCGTTNTDPSLLIAMRGKTAIRFHYGAWDDGTNPRLCRDCRLGRGCDCQGCREERAGTLSTHRELSAVTPSGRQA